MMIMKMQNNLKKRNDTRRREVIRGKNSFVEQYQENYKTTKTEISKVINQNLNARRE